MGVRYCIFAFLVAFAVAFSPPAHLNFKDLLSGPHSFPAHNLQFYVSTSDWSLLDQIQVTLDGQTYLPLSKYIYQGGPNNAYNAPSGIAFQQVADPNLASKPTWSVIIYIVQLDPDYNDIPNVEPDPYSNDLNAFTSNYPLVILNPAFETNLGITINSIKVKSGTAVVQSVGDESTGEAKMLFTVTPDEASQWVNTVVYGPIIRINGQGSAIISPSEGLQASRNQQRPPKSRGIVMSSKYAIEQNIFRQDFTLEETGLGKNGKPFYSLEIRYADTTSGTLVIKGGDQSFTYSNQPDITNENLSKIRSNKVTISYTSTKLSSGFLIEYLADSGSASISALATLLVSVVFVLFK
ncbi:hypothetical protein L596_026334 [Steinernema carpocapsae]|uniref:Uncharacterized protein n=1 Tax=Steinernema carpocapsae TaxID=34508 RepID=A0A4V5ZY60_STECR|nr:hypothetical protein L596_026334 [Steinernema carpocapsae]